MFDKVHVAKDGSVVVHLRNGCKAILRPEGGISSDLDLIIKNGKGKHCIINIQTDYATSDPPRVDLWAREGTGLAVIPGIQPHTFKSTQAAFIPNSVTGVTLNVEDESFSVISDGPIDLVSLGLIR